MQRVVVLFPGALGDLLLAVPALRLLRHRHRGARFVVAVNGPLVDLARRLGVADGVERVDGAALARCFGGGDPPEWLGPRDLVHSWLGGDDPEVVARLRAACDRVVVHRVERGPGAMHAAVAYARGLGVSESEGELAAELAAAGAMLRRTLDPTAALLAGDAPWLVVHPGAGGAAKCWPLEGFQAVAAWWRGRGGRVAAIHGPAEVGARGLDADRLIDGPTLATLAGVLAGARAYVGNDSGVSHLAAVVGVRGVVVFGPTQPERWRPLSEHLHACAPLVPGPASTADVSPERVCAALRGYPSP